jgi:hypothetical protein
MNGNYQLKLKNMKGVIVILVPLLILGVLPGCALFKKTTKRSTEGKVELNKQMELDKLAVKTGQKETNVLTYWPDGAVYQWENRIEQLDEARYGKLRVEENAVTKTEGTAVESVPSYKWLVVVASVILIMLLCFLKYRN